MSEIDAVFKVAADVRQFLAKAAVFFIVFINKSQSLCCSDQHVKDQMPSELLAVDYWIK